MMICYKDYMGANHTTYHMYMKQPFHRACYTGITRCVVSAVKIKLIAS